MRKIVIVMTYFERPFQLERTLKSIALSKHDNYEIVIVDDCSEDAPVNIIPDNATLLRTNRKTWTNPEPAYNVGLYYAMLQKPEIIILQNAECYHQGHILSYADQNLTDENYISFGCFSIDKESTFKSQLKLNNIGASHDGENAWYNHPVYRPVAYDFCSAITVKNMKLLNGYDERFSEGCGRGDDYLLQRIRMLGLRVDITSDPFVVHQWHYTGQGVPQDKAMRVEKNRILYNELLPLKEIRAKHIYTPDLCECY